MTNTIFISKTAGLLQISELLNYNCFVGKMPGSKRKFNNVWLSAIDSNGKKLSSWCRKGRDDFHTYCQFCDSEFLCDNSEKSQILQHAKKAKHVQAVKPFID